MIGDRAGDVLAARANGVGSVGVLWGHGSRTSFIMPVFLPRGLTTLDWAKANAFKSEAP